MIILFHCMPCILFMINQFENQRRKNCLEFIAYTSVWYHFIFKICAHMSHQEYEKWDEITVFVYEMERMRFFLLRNHSTEQAANNAKPEKNIYNVRVRFTFSFFCVCSVSLFKHEDLLDFFHVLLSAVAYAWIFHDQIENDSKPFHYNFRAAKSNNFSFRFSSVEHSISSTDQSVCVCVAKRTYFMNRRKMPRNGAANR